MCGSKYANLDLTDLTTAVGGSTSYGSSSYYKSVIDACTTSTVKAQLKPFYGKTFDFAITDTTGGAGTGATAKYRGASSNVARSCAKYAVDEQICEA